MNFKQVVYPLHLVLNITNSLKDFSFAAFLVKNDMISATSWQSISIISGSNSAYIAICMPKLTVALLHELHLH